MSVLVEDRWEVLLSVPRDVGDLGLHQPEDLAAAHFRRQLAAELGEEHAARVGPAAERQFRKARALHAGRPVLWAGFIMTATPAATGVAADTSTWPTDPADRAELEDLAATQDAMLVSLTVGVRELTLPELPAAPAAVVSRAVKARLGGDANVHLVRYGDVDGVAVVRTEEIDAPLLRRAGLPAGDGRAGVHVLAEVHLLFPEEEALVTVTAATPNGGAVNDAVLLAGSIARGVRVRSTDTDTDGSADTDASAGTDASADPGGRSAPATLGILLPDGHVLPEGLTLIGRAPRGAERVPADHTVTLRDPSVSRAHLTLQVADGAVTVTDLHSTNGTRLRRRDGEVLALVPDTPTALAAGDEVELGAARLRVVERRDPGA